MMITIIGNLKGGSGKSTVTFNLALWLAQVGKTVVTYDLDLQRTLSDVAQVRQEEKYEPPLVVYTQLNLPQQPLNQSEILIDVGTGNMTEMKRAISLADRVVVPVVPSQADIWSTQRFLYFIASEARGKPPEIFMFINRADTHSNIRESDQAHQALNVLPGVKVLQTRLYQRIVYRRSFSEGLAVFELEPSGKAAKEFKEFAKFLYSSNN
ncbi:division plane positioning ATPase MipZ [Candidatus Parabeggiatoa sp. HSG14]|uniref:nucleotide-binding protein n=1 Tax=Candidatus Parabeggiatoa sp. HSG14 TaxID=3055593 RepID=UPI0025A8EAF8|nr:division plane positioning ATPase MipZ [Thiotrichales bacterium HSG14]